MTTPPTPTPRRRGKLRFLKYAALTLAILILGLVILIALQPADYRVERKATIAAAPETLFALINDFHRWEAWSPWEKLDPAMKRSFEGSPAGQGAIYAWAGNDNVGEGRMTLTESQPPQRILIQLDFIKPMAGTSLTEFTFAPAAGGTTLTWTMSGKNDFLGKAFCLVMNMDKMIGPDFEKGLAQLKTIAEAPAK